MTDTPERPTETTGPISGQTAAHEPPPPPPAPVENRPRPNRLNAVAAWVGIVAGVVFVVAVIFGTGFMLGKHAGGGDPHFGRTHDAVMFKHRGPGPMGPMGDFERGPFMIPRGPAFAPPPPNQPQQPGSPTPATPERP